MKTVVLGAGALGSILAGHLAKAGEDVTLLARGARARNLADNGLKIRGASELATPIRVIERPQDVTDADLLIVTVKTYDMESALEPLRHVKAAAVFGVQNGVLKNDQLAGVFGRQAVLGCAADFSGEVDPDGVVHFTRNNGVIIGELPSGVSERVRNIVAMIEASGVKAVGVENIQTDEWSKFVAWLSMTPPAVLSRLYTHQVLQDPNLALLMVQLAREAAQVPQRLGVPLEDTLAVAGAKSMSTRPLDEAAAHQQEMGRGMEAQGLVTHKMSALQDLDRGRRLELEATLGYMVRKAAELGLEMPRLDACYRLMAAIGGPKA